MLKIPSREKVDSPVNFLEIEVSKNVVQIEVTPPLVSPGTVSRIKIEEKVDSR